MTHPRTSEAVGLELLVDHLLARVPAAILDRVSPLVGEDERDGERPEVAVDLREQAHVVVRDEVRLIAVEGVALGVGVGERLPLALGQLHAGVRGDDPVVRDGLVLAAVDVRELLGPEVLDVADRDLERLLVALALVRRRVRRRRRRGSGHHHRTRHRRSCPARAPPVPRARSPRGLRRPLPRSDDARDTSWGQKPRLWHTRVPSNRLGRSFLGPASREDGPMDPASLDDAVRGGDLDELLRLVDACCSSRDWEALASLRARCERAYETGHQLWPVSSHAAYRLALEAPAPFAAAVLVEGAGRFAPGPLPEVAAQGHSWDELAPAIPPGAPAMYAAHERVLRGEDLRGAARWPARARAPAAARVLGAGVRARRVPRPRRRLPRAAGPFEATGRAPDPTRTTRARRSRGRAARRRARVGRRLQRRDRGRHRRRRRGRGHRNPGARRRLDRVRGVRRSRSPTSHGPARAAALTAVARAPRRVASRRGGPARRSAACSTTGRPTRSASGIASPSWAGCSGRASEPTTGWRLQLAVEDPARGRAWAIRAIDHRT